MSLEEKVRKGSKILNAYNDNRDVKGVLWKNLKRTCALKELKELSIAKARQFTATQVCSVGLKLKVENAYLWVYTYLNKWLNKLITQGGGTNNLFKLFPDYFVDTLIFKEGKHSFRLSKFGLYTVTLFPRIYENQGGGD